MKAMVESTLVGPGMPAGTKARVWKGTTENGIDFEMVVVRVAVDRTADTAEFEQDLQEHAPPAAVSAFPLWMVL